MKIYDQLNQELNIGDLVVCTIEQTVEGLKVILGIIDSIEEPAGINWLGHENSYYITNIDIKRLSPFIRRESDHNPEKKEIYTLTQSSDNTRNFSTETMIFRAINILKILDPKTMLDTVMMIKLKGTNDV